MKTKFFATVIATVIAVNMSAATKLSSKQEASMACATPVMIASPVSNQKVLLVSDENNRAHRYEYNLDENGRVTSRVSYIYSSLMECWRPASAYSVYYGEDTTVLTYAEYDPSCHTFTSNAKQSRFSASDYPEVIRLPKACK